MTYDGPPIYLTITWDEGERETHEMSSPENAQEAGRLAFASGAVAVKVSYERA